MVPWLSILIPIYNVQDYLVECLFSVIRSVRTRTRAQLYKAVGMSKWELSMTFLKQRDLKRFLRVVALL